jgi:predicted PurR-regulated permease PerM
MAEPQGRERDTESTPLDSGEAERPARFSRGGLIALSIASALFVWFAIDLLLLLFAGLLFAIFLRAPSHALASRTRIGEGLALALVLLALVGIATGGSILFAGQLSNQAQAITQRVPEAINTVVDRLEEHEWTRWVVDRVRDEPSPEGGDQSRAAGEEAGEDSGESDDGERQGGLPISPTAIAGQVAGAASQLISLLVAVVIVIFTGIYLAAAPEHYIRGVLRLTPIRRRERIGEVLYAVGYTLRWWLFGQLGAMILVGVVMGTGLALIGVPLALGLGVLAGLFEFVPTVGPVLGVLPAILIALIESPQMALYVLVLYGLLQGLEGYLITPLIQQRVVHLPPVLTIAVQVLMTWRLGPMGLVVAVPLMAATMVIVQMLYVKDVLTDRFPLAAEEEGRRELQEAGLLKSLI